MLASKSEYLDLKKPRNYLIYCTGIAVELAAVFVLMAIGYAIPVLGFWFCR